MKTKKKFGQNFLVDKNKIDEIIQNLQIDSSTNIFEVGPGLGALTISLSKISNNITCVEIDNEAIEILKKKIPSNVKIIHSDILKLDITKVVKQKDKQKTIMVSNLPYYIATPIIFKFLEADVFSYVNIMLQKEMADRIFASTNEKAYGRLTVALNTYYERLKIIEVNKNCFQPSPKVDSAFIILKRNNVLYDKEYLMFIKDCFSHKRKTLFNSLLLSKNYDKELLQNLYKIMSIDQNTRAEQLEISDFKDFYKKINSLRN